jgi:putative ABC transport system permease protein
MKKEHFTLAFNNLKRRKLRSWLTILGIFVGIAAVVSLISLGDGLRTAVMGQFGSLSVDKLTIQNKGSGFGVPGSTVVEKLNDEDVEIIRGVNGVRIVVPRIIRIAGIEYNEILSFGYVADLPKNSEEADLVYSAFSAEVEEGRLLKEEDRKKVLLGNDVANNEEFEKKIRVGDKIKINNYEFEVVGILKKSSSFQINMVHILPREDLEQALEIKNEYDLIVAEVEDKDRIQEISEAIKEELRQSRNLNEGEEDFTVETPLQAIASVNTILNLINIVIAGIAGISLFVGGVGIMNTMYTSILERKKEIGVMKSIGAKNSDIAKIFLIESGLLGLVGGIIGAVFGISIALFGANMANKFLGEELFTVSISYILIFEAILFSFVVGAVSGVLPAIQASKTKIVDALRNTK